MTVDIVAYIELEAVPETQRKENLLLISAVVSPDWEPYNLTSDTSRTETVVQEIELDVTFETLPQFQKLQWDADTGSGDAATTKMTQPAGSRELIHVHPRKLCFPLEQNSKMPFSLQVTNVTDKYVPFYLLSGDKKPNRCHRMLDTELLLPHTTMGLVAYLELEAVPDQNCQKKVRVLSYTMDENMRLDVTHEIELEVVFVAPIQIQKNLTLDGQNGSGDATIQGFIETELLNIGPMELRFPFEPNRWIKRSIQLRNMTDDDVTIWILPENRERYFVKGCNPSGTVLPQSSEPVTIFVGIKEEELPTKNTDNLNILMATTSSLGQFNLNGCRSIRAVYDEVFKAARETGGKAHMACLRAVIYDPEEMKELIDVKPRNLCFPLELNKRMSFSIQLTNRTDDHVALMLVPGHKLARACRLPWDRVLLSPQMTVGLVAYMEVEAGDEAVEETIAVLSTIVSKDMEHKDIYMSWVHYD
ncbi:hypothetical protein PR202_ga27795 [Eleusine coracana subsp. coracana]|uniref:Uncharacterized protein n=1 Tax=Eleusine coracana subsp. coracana TaxID=191504 RepID=A0AAV5DHS2_ELECO|nr:hypothetical protein PR202_ga27795 [Eleusine coracana subsp. coracana]